MVEIKTLDEIRAIVEAELRKHPGCEDACIRGLKEFTDKTAPSDWALSSGNAGSSRDWELCLDHLSEIIPRLQQQYRVRPRKAKGKQ
jgi:hypothetical protein